MKTRLLSAFFGSLLMFFGCSSQTFHVLPALPFQITLPNAYEFLESDSNYIFSPQGGPATLVFEKHSTNKNFFELFDNGYEEVTQKSSGVWVICEEGNLENCFVQNMNFMELYPLHIRSDDILKGEEKQTIYEVLNKLSAD